MDLQGLAILFELKNGYTSPYGFTDVKKSRYHTASRDCSRPRMAGYRQSNMSPAGGVDLPPKVVEKKSIADYGQ